MKYTLKAFSTTAHEEKEAEAGGEEICLGLSLTDEELIPLLQDFEPMCIVHHIKPVYMTFRTSKMLA